MYFGGGSGIRTLEGLTSLLVFKTSAFNRSANPPNGVACQAFAAPLEPKCSSRVCLQPLCHALQGAPFYTS